MTHLQETALCVAVNYSLSTNVDLLLEANADITLSFHGREPPLHLAARFGDMEIVKVFVSRGTDLLLENSSGFTPELVARHNGHLGIANFLKERTSAENGNNVISKCQINTSKW